VAIPRADGAEHPPVTTTMDGSPLSGKQLARRDRVIQAALELGAEGGYEAVNMREVANRARVALGTIYRYFGSKDHLLAAAMVEWSGQLQGRLAQVPARGATPADRLVDVLRRGCRALERHPVLTAALVKALASAEPGVAAAAAEVRGHITAMTGSIVVGVSDDELEGIIAVLQHVWYSSLTSWASGRTPLSTVGDELERAARLLLAAHPHLGGQMARSRPTQ